MASAGQGGSCSIEFRRFDIVSNASDHRYNNFNLPHKQMRSFTNANGSVQRQIMKEWKILEKYLPDSIYVRAYETRIDLLRAVIIDAQGTPYHDGLFFFDIVFPSDYPNQPPQVYYHSHGHRLNPNLYANGNVCLSLINTWYGSKLEKWTPTKSTILQLLVSIQGLILNDKPYFNEPGYGVLRNWRIPYISKLERGYNENVILSSCKIMVNLMNNPPKHFESFVKDHFRMRAEHILAALGAYRNGLCSVGHYTSDGPSPLETCQVSPTFKANLDAVSASLHRAFKKIGKTVLIANNSGTVEKGSQAKIAITQTKAKFGSSSSTKPQAVTRKPKISKPKSSKQKGVWNKFSSAIAWFFK